MRFSNGIKNLAQKEQNIFVDRAGFEPATSSMPSRRANQLRQRPVLKPMVPPPGIEPRSRA